MINNHGHSWLDCTPILCRTFPSVAQELGAPMMAYEDNKEWCDAEKWRELEKYRQGFRAFMCACSAVKVFNPNVK